MARETYFGFDITQKKTLERLMASDDAGLSALATSVANLNAWATAFATKLNADHTANNLVIADAVLATDYDTNPQA